MVLELNNITKKCGKTLVLQKFSYKFISGNVYLLHGENGSGKTTLLKCISSLYAIEDGQIIWNNRIVEGYKQRSLYRSQVALLTNSEGSLLPNLNTIQNIKYFMGMNNIEYKEISQQALELMKAFHLDEHLNKPVYKLSKGMKQKVALIITFLKGRNIILLDEPYDGLDTNAEKVLNGLIRTNSNEKIIILTSPNCIDTICTEIIEMNR